MATILIVDDLISNRKALVALLSHEGHRLLEAPNGRVGLASVLAHHPDLVITDVLMPVVDGYEFVRQLRQNPATSAIPVLFYTASYGEREARALAKASGVPYVLTKPPRPDEVLSIVGRVLAGNAEIEATADAESADAAVDREQLRLLGDQLTETAEDLRVANARLRALINIGLDFASQRDSDHRLRRLCVAAHDLFGADYVTIGLLGRDDRRVHRVVASGAEASPWIEEGAAVAGIFKTVVDGRRSVRGSIPAGELSDRPFPASHPEVQSFLISPITSLEHVYGWICLVANEERAAFTDEEESQVLALAGQVGRIYELEREVLERRQAEGALTESERFNRNLLEHLPHRIVVRDRQSVVRFCNANYASSLGISVDDAVGKDASTFHLPAAAEAQQAEDHMVMLSGTLVDVEEPCEVHGQTRWQHSVKVPYRDEQGEVTGVLVVTEDITERRVLEERSHQAQKMEAVGRLAGGLAHDFNNLLTVILGYCELLFSDLEMPDRHRVDITEINKAGLRAADLTKQLLAFSRKEIIEPTTVDLNAVVTELRPMLDRLIREDVKIIVEPSQSLGAIRADRGQVEQIVLNLAVNARDAMPTGGTLTIGTANVHLDEHTVRRHPLLKPGAYVALRVTDTGSGMPPEVTSRIFEPFFTTKAAGRGTGLGLASVQATMARSGGTIEVHSEPGKGTTFCVYFPLAEAVSSTDASKPAAPTLAATQTVLVVEHTDALRSVTSRLLTLQGYRVLGAANAQQALELCSGNVSLDVVLTDVVMPGSSGPEMTRILLDRRPLLKVVYMTGCTDDAIVQHGVLRPGIALLRKPFTAETLGRKIRAALEAPISAVS